MAALIVLRASCRRRSEGVPSAASFRRRSEKMARVKTSKRGAATLLVATRKGLWQLKSDAARRTWRLSGPQFLGHVIHHCVADSRNDKSMLAAARTGPPGPTISRSTDRGRTGREGKQPRASREGSGRV